MVCASFFPSIEAGRISQSINAGQEGPNHRHALVSAPTCRERVFRRFVANSRV